MPMPISCGTASNDITLQGIRTGPARETTTALTAHLLMAIPQQARRLVAELSLQPGVYAVHCMPVSTRRPNDPRH